MEGREQLDSVRRTIVMEKYLRSYLNLYRK
jgi:hypothetical protein